MGSTVFWIVFAVALAGVIPFIVMYARRGVTKWHRPHIGEVVLFSIILVMVAGALSLVVVKMFDLDEMLQGAEKGMKHDRPGPKPVEIDSATGNEVAPQG